MISIFFDGWCLYNVAEYLRRYAIFSVGRLANLPKYVPPSASSDFPFAPAGEDCPYPVLGRGMPYRPKHPFTTGEDALHFLLVAAESVHCDTLFE